MLACSLGKESYDKSRQYSKAETSLLPAKVHIVTAMIFPVVMYRDESWTIRNAECWRTDFWNCGAGEDSWESLGLHGDQTSYPKGNQPWIFLGRTDAEAKAPILWLRKEPTSRLIGKDPDAGKDWGRRRRDDKDKKGVTETSLTPWTWVWAISRR